MELAFALLLSFLAGISTVIGGILSVFVKKTKFCYLCIAFGFSAGVMIFVSFAELLPHAVEALGFQSAVTGFFLGAALIYGIDILVPHKYKAETSMHGKSRIKRTAILLLLGITIHNFPEGIAVMFSTISETNLGILIAVSIAMHNIPEGIAIAMPIYYATKKKKDAILYSLLSGLAEPAGALAGFLFLYPFLNDFVLGLIISAVAGIMVFISFDELLPYVYNQHDSSDQHMSILGIFLGMFVMALTMIVI